MIRAVHCPAPTGPERSFRAGNFRHLVVFKRTQSLGNHRIGPSWKFDYRAEVILQFGMVRAAPVRPSIDALRLAMTRKIPSRQVKEMNGFFQDPTSNPVDLITPAIGTLAIRPSPEFDYSVERLADRASANHLLDL